MERSTMTPRTRSLALAGVLALTLTVGAAAFAVGGPLGALAATGTPTTGQGTQATPGTARHVEIRIQGLLVVKRAGARGLGRRLCRTGAPSRARSSSKGKTP